LCWTGNTITLRYIAPWDVGAAVGECGVEGGVGGMGRVCCVLRVRMVNAATSPHGMCALRWERVAKREGGQNDCWGVGNAALETRSFQRKCAAPPVLYAQHLSLSLCAHILVLTCAVQVDYTKLEGANEKFDGECGVCMWHIQRAQCVESVLVQRLACRACRRIKGKQSSPTFRANSGSPDRALVCFLLLWRPCDPPA